MRNDRCRRLAKIERTDRNVDDQSTAAAIERISGAMT